MSKVKEIIEQLHRDIALIGGALPTYHDTEILETEGSRASDPFRQSFRDNWWDRATPAMLREVSRDKSKTLLRQLEHVSRNVARDEASEKQKRMTKFVERWRKSANFARDAAPAATLTEKYFGAPDDAAGQALANLAKHVDVNSSQAAPWWSTLNSYVRKLSPGGLVRDLDGKVVESCIQEIFKTKETR